MNRNDYLLKKTFFNKYKPIKRIGEGSFARIYSAKNIKTNEKFALKMEYIPSNKNTLENESLLLYYLKGIGIPSIKSYGYSDDYNILVMELLGKSFDILFEEQNKKFTLKTISMIAIQMLERIEFIHNKNIIHRDIKPDNFSMGIDNKNYILYILDFGLSKKYKSKKTNEHIKYKENIKKLTGTARYASINALGGCEQSRRDDLESIGYVLLYFLKGNLPWQGLKIEKGEDRFKKIYLKKKEINSEILCFGLPNEIKIYIDYTRNLKFEENPDYSFLKGLFVSILEREKCYFDFYFDWMNDKCDFYDNLFLKYMNMYLQINHNLDFYIIDKENKNEYYNENIFWNMGIEMEKYVKKIIENGPDTDIEDEEKKNDIMDSVNNNNDNNNDNNINMNINDINNKDKNENIINYNNNNMIEKNDIDNNNLNKDDCFIF